MTLSLNKIVLRLIMSMFFMSMGIGTMAQAKTNFRKAPPLDSAVGYASFYSNKFIGKKTANGEIFTQDKLTCAHNTHPMGTLLTVTNLKNGKEVVVRVNDRLHHRNPRIIDLSRRAAEKLDFTGGGVIKVSVEVIKKGQF